HMGGVVREGNGKPMQTVIADLRARLSAATEGYFRSRCATALSLADSTTAFTLRSPDGRTRTVNVDPGDGHFPRVARPDSISQVRPGVWYVDLDRIHDQDWTRELPRLSQARGIVFDLRGYPAVSALPLASLVRDSLWC